MVSSVQFLTPMPAQPDKPLFVFLPGMDGTGTLLRNQLDGLVPWFDIRCLALGAEDHTQWKPLARQVGHLIGQTLKASAKTSNGGPRRMVYLCGESFGGCLAMQLLALFPQLFDRVILVNPASSFRRLPWMQLGPLITRQLPNLAYRYSALGLVPFLIESYRVEKSDRRALGQAMGSVPAKTASWRLELLSKFDAERLPLEHIDYPVLLIVGGKDRLLPSKREAQMLVRRFPNAKMTLLPRSGHACLLEAEVKLGEILKTHRFLPNHSPSHLSTDADH